MHISVRGTGPALVMVHGWALHGGIFAPLAEQLEARFTLHIVDLPGHGRSRASALPFSLEATAGHIVERIPAALWLGWSLGGLVALHAAQQFPAAVRGLVMLCASPRFLQSPDWPDGMPASVFGQFAQNLGRDFRATLDRFLMLQVQGSDQARGELRMLRETAFEYGEPEPGILGEGLALLENSDLRGGLPTLAMPSLWLAGRHDRQVSTRSMRTAAEQTPHSRFLEISHGGHLPFLTQADVVAQAVTTFIERAPA